MLSTVSDGNFEADVLQSSVPVLVDFYADWCNPCKQQVPALESVASSFDGKVKVVKLNVDDSQNTALKFGVQSIPTLILFKDGEVHQRFVGLQNEKSVEAFLEKHDAVTDSAEATDHVDDVR